MFGSIVLTLLPLEALEPLPDSPSDDVKDATPQQTRLWRPFESREESQFYEHCFAAE